MHDAVSRKPAGVNPPSGVRMRTYDGAVVWTDPVVAPPASAEIDPHILPPRISIDSSQKYVLEPILIYSFGETKLLTQVVEPEDHPVQLRTDIDARGQVDSERVGTLVCDRGRQEDLDTLRTHRHA